MQSKWANRGSPEYLEHNRQYLRERRAADVRHALLYGARGRAKKAGIPFNITVDDLIIPAECPILGIPIFVGTGKVSSNSPTLDRIINNRGYVRGNIAIISNRANRLKSDITREQARKLVEYMETAE